MTPEVPAPAFGWSRMRLGVLTVLLTAVQFVLVVNVGRVPGPPPVLEPPRGEVTLVLDGEQAQVVQEGLPPARLDVFGRDREDAFQRVAFASVPKSEYRLREWVEPSRWLTNPTVLAPVRMPAVPDAVRDLGSARPPTPPTPVAGLVARENLVEVEGAPRRRGWKVPPVLKPWAGTEPTGPTRLEVSVNPQGWVVLAQVSGGSGSREADEMARLAIRAALVEPVAGAGRKPEFEPEKLETGMVTVHWTALGGGR